MVKPLALLQQCPTNLVRKIVTLKNVLCGRKSYKVKKNGKPVFILTKIETSFPGFR